MIRFAPLALLLLLASCATPPSPTAAGPDHPANPAATSGSAGGDQNEHAGHMHDASGHDQAQAALYQCPMHPKVTSSNPEDRCPECSMKINQPVKKEGNR